MREVSFHLNSIIIVIGLLFSAIYSIVLCVYIWVRGKKDKTIVWYLICQSLLTLWTILHLFEMVTPTIRIRWFIVSINYISICYFAAAFYMFARSYNMKTVTSWKVKIAVFGLPTLMYLSFITNPFHYLFYRAFYIDGEVYGPLCYVLFIMDVAYIALAAIELISNKSNQSVYKKQQVAFALIAIIIPFIVHFLFIINWFDVGFNMTLIILPLPYTMITISVIKYQFLDILPLTLSDAVETIDDGFLVINIQKNIEDYNRVFFNRFMNIEGCKTFEDFLLDIGCHTTNRAVLDNLKYSLNVRGESYISGEIVVQKDGVEMVFQYTSKAINDYHNVKIATIITFHDITEIQSLYREYEEKKQELIVVRSKLEEHMATVQLLSIETERNKLMTEVHDTMGHSMTELLAIMEKCDMMLSNEDVEGVVAKEAITHALDMARETLAEIRSAVTKFRKMGLEK